MQGNIITGASFLITGIKTLFLPGLKRFIMVPIIINFFIFIGVVYFSAIYVWQMFTGLTNEFPVWAIYVLGWLLWIIFSLASILITATMFVFVTNFIASPFYAKLSEKAEIIIKGDNDLTNNTAWQQQNPPTVSSILMQMPNSILRELRKYLYYIPWLLIVAILFIFPLTLPIAPFAWFLVMAWIIAIEFSDFTHQLYRHHHFNSVLYHYLYSVERVDSRIHRC